MKFQFCYIKSSCARDSSPALQVHIGWISKKIPSLQLLARLKIHKTLAEVEAVDSLPLPCRLRSLISSLFTHSIKVSFWNTEMFNMCNAYGMYMSNVHLYHHYNLYLCIYHPNLVQTPSFISSMPLYPDSFNSFRGQQNHSLLYFHQCCVWIVSSNYKPIK